MICTELLEKKGNFTLGAVAVIGATGTELLEKKGNFTHIALRKNFVFCIELLEKKGNHTLNERQDTLIDKQNDFE